MKLILKSALIFLQNGSNGTVVSPLPETRCSLLPLHGSLLCVVKTPLFPHNNQWKTVSVHELRVKANQRKVVGRGNHFGQSYYGELPLYSSGLCSFCSSGSLRNNTHERN